MFKSNRESNHQSEQSQSDDEWAHVLIWLDALRSQLGSTRSKERTKGTCRWIEGKDLFQKWRFGKGSAGLWVFGKPGNVDPRAILDVLRSKN